MTTLTTTFALLRKYGACAEGYRKLAKHLRGWRSYGAETPIPLAVILDSNGVDDTLWSLRAVPEDQRADRDRVARLFACDCAERALPLFEHISPGEQRPRRAIETARRHAVGQATGAELEAARAAAAAAWAAARAARAAVRMAAWARAQAGTEAEQAARAARAAEHAASAAAWAAAERAQASLAAVSAREAAWAAARAEGTASAAAWAEAAESEWQAHHLQEMLSP